MTDPHAGASLYRDEIDEAEAAALPAGDPNVAAAEHDGGEVVDHERHLGDFIDDDGDDPMVVVTDAERAVVEPDLDGDGLPDDDEQEVR